MKPGLFDMMEFMNFLFAVEKSEWRQNKEEMCSG